MGYHNIFAREQLLALIDAIQRQRKNVARREGDDELDEEYKTGARDAFSKVIDLAFERVEQLESEQK